MGNLKKPLAQIVLGLVFALLFAAQLTIAQTNSPPSLHHFEFSYIEGQVAGAPFNITITAKDQFNQTYTSYNGASTLSATLTITKTVYSQDFGVIGAFVNGVWTGEITLEKGGGITYFRTIAQGRNEGGLSNKFFVSGPLLPSVLDHFRFDPISNQVVGVPFSIKITAEDQYNQTFATYTGVNSLTGIMVNLEITDVTSWRQVSLGSTGAFVNGVWSGQISLPEAWYAWGIGTSGSGKDGFIGGIRAINPYTSTPKPYDTNSTPKEPSSTPTKTQTPATSPTAAPSVPEFPWSAILPLLIGTLTVAPLLRHRKNFKTR